MSSTTPEPIPGHALKVDVNTGTKTTPTWTPLSGVTATNPSSSSQMADVTDFDSPGWEKSLPVQRGMSFSVPLNYKQTAAGAEDPGQARLKTLGQATGASAIGEFRYTPGAGQAVRFDATVDIAYPGGGTTDIAKMTAELKMYGPPRPVTT